MYLTVEPLKNNSHTYASNSIIVSCFVPSILTIHTKKQKTKQNAYFTS